MTSFQLSSIHLYPVKSLAGIEVKYWPVNRRGLFLDRHWMIVDEEGRFLSQRSHPEMATIKTSLDNESLTISTAGMGGLGVAIEQDAAATKEVSIWRDNCTAHCVGKEADEWFSEVLKESCHLVYLPAESKRWVEEEYAEPGDQVAFADAYPFLVIGTASLDDLNSKLDTPIEMSRFRPNLIIKTNKPYVEDQWRRIQIGSIPLRLPKPCSRCTIPNVNPDTGVRDNNEPIKTLVQYRKSGNNVFFGQNALPGEPGTLSVGTKVEILEIGPAQPNLNL